MPRTDIGSGSGTPLNLSSRPIISRNASSNTAVLRELGGGSSSPRPGAGVAGSTRAAVDHRRRLSSLPISSATNRSPERETALQQESEPLPVRSPSPGPAESSSTASSEDESSPAQSRIIRRPPRFQHKDVATYDEDDDDDSSEPAFQPYEASSDRASGDLGSTLRGDNRASTKRFPKSISNKHTHQSQTSDSSTGSAALVKRPGKPREQRAPGPLSPRRAAELAVRSPGSKSQGYSREGSDGTPSMGSSYSDLDGN